MTKNNKPQSFSLPSLKELESYCDLMNEKKIGIIHIETDEIKLKLCIIDFLVRFSYI